MGHDEARGYIGNTCVNSRVPLTVHGRRAAMAAIKPWVRDVRMVIWMQVLTLPCWGTGGVCVRAH